MNTALTPMDSVTEIRIIADSGGLFLIVVVYCKAWKILEKASQIIIMFLVADTTFTKEIRIT